jgi:predicted transcriptional regulator
MVKGTSPRPLTNKEQIMSAVSTTVLSDLAGFSVEDKTAEQILTLMVKKSKQVTEHSIALSAMAYVLLIDRSYNRKEAADKLEMSEASVSMYAKRGRVLSMSADKITALKIWNQIVVLTDKELDDLAAHLVTTEEPAQMVEDVTMRKVVVNRLGENASPEAVDTLVEGLKASGNTQPRAVRSAVADVAQAVGVTLPTVKRQTNSPDEAAGKVPTAAGALATLTKFEQDREAGSEGLGFAITEEEATALIETAKTAIRTLRRAGRLGQVAEIGIFLNESVEMVEA